MCAVVSRLGSTLAALALASLAAANAAAPLSATWRLLENRSDNTYHAELTLRNETAAPLPPTWALYFNSAGPVLTKPAQGDAEVEHINGDLYVLRPAKASTPIPPGETLRMVLVGNSWAINFTDSPSGMYVVDLADKDASPTSVSLQIQPFPDAKLVRR